MALLATLYIEEDDADERRGAPRRSVGRETTLRQAGLATTVTLYDLSSTGASIETATPLSCGESVTIGLAGVGRFGATVVSQASSRYGCQFDRPLSADATDRAFRADPVVLGAFGETDSAALPDLPMAERYPGFVRIGLPVLGAVAGWAAAIHVVEQLWR